MSSGRSRLSDKVAIVTGGSRGIGRAICKRFAEEGARLAIVFNSASEAAAEVQKEVDALHAKSILIQADVSNSNDVARMVESTMKAFGRVDVLVNNAGIVIRKKFLDSTEEDWDRTMDVNLKSVYLCSKAVAPVMLERGRGKIVNIASISGLYGPPSALENPDYAASKAGVVGLTKALAVSLAPSINVNVVCPGATQTDMLSGMTDEGKKMRLAETPLRRLGRPEEIAEAVLFLASDESDFVTGETLVVSGGRPML